MLECYGEITSHKNELGDIWAQNIIKILIYKRKNDFMNHDRLKRMSYYIWKNYGEPLAVMGGLFVGGSLLGAVAGEIADHIPYFRNAIPQGLALLSFGKIGAEYFYGNLDKIGSIAGAVLVPAFIRIRMPFGTYTKK